MSTEDDDYQVGRNRPPKKTRFRKGKSGNSKGRPKGARNFRTELRNELAGHISVVEGNKHIKVSKTHAVLKRLIMDALRGNQKAIDRLLKYAEQIDDEEANTTAENTTEDDVAIIANFEKRVLTKLRHEEKRS